jgi:hypothetical protein
MSVSTGAGDTYRIVTPRVRGAGKGWKRGSIRGDVLVVWFVM